MAFQAAAGEARRSAHEGIRAIGGEVAHLDRTTRALTKEYPLLVLGGALLFGFLCARIASRA